jgi:hypothetical protein
LVTEDSANEKTTRSGGVRGGRRDTVRPFLKPAEPHIVVLESSECRGDE